MSSPGSCCCFLFAQSYMTLWDLMDWRPTNSSVHGISQARILEWVASSFSRGSSQPKDQTQVSWFSSPSREIPCPHAQGQGQRPGGATPCPQAEARRDAGRDWGQEEKGMTEDEMAGWHHQLDGRKFEWTPGVGDGQGGLACCDSWGLKESDTTERLNWTELKIWIDKRFV